MSTLEEAATTSTNNTTETSSKKCEICHQVDHKYKCPRCSMKTCSLDCCRKHKTEKDCSGVRDKTKFVGKEGFDESLIINDYRFLEENNLLVDTLQRNTLEQCEPLKQPNVNGGASENLRKFLYKQHGINLKIMPAQSTRRLNNKTRFNKTTGLVSWSVEFILFVDRVEGNNVYFKQDSKSTLFSDKDPLDKLINKFFTHYKLEIMNDEKNKKVSSAYRLATLDESNSIAEQVHVLFQVTDLSRQTKYFVEFDKSKTLEECLKHRTIIEYPSLYLIRDEDLSNFKIEKETETSQTNGNGSSQSEHEEGSEKDEEEEEKSPETIDVLPKTVERPVIASTVNNDSEIEDGECDDDDEDEEATEISNQAKKLKP